MSDIIELRDHSQPCEHGFIYSHQWLDPDSERDPLGETRWHYCDGGKLRRYRQTKYGKLFDAYVRYEIAESEKVWVEVIDGE